MSKKDKDKTDSVDDDVSTDSVDESDDAEQEETTKVINVRAEVGSGKKHDKHASHEDKCEALGVDPDYAHITDSRNEFPEMSPQQFRKFVNEELSVETENDDE